VGQRRGVTVRLLEINGQPGLVGIENGAVIAAWALLISDGVIQAIHGVTNPDKLAHISSTILPSFRPA
jgi:RNA polymerase sigma-70 factor (ECF subfamily)